MGSNCMASFSIGCLFCFKGCSAEKVRNAFTFVPPRPSYSVEDDQEDASKGRLKYRMLALANSSVYGQASEASTVHWVTSRRGSRVPLVWVRREACSRDVDEGSEPADPGRSEPLVLLHCHGNATDIGLMMGPYLELAKVLGVEVVGVEYTGYGAARGAKPSYGHTLADLEAAYDFVVASGVSPSRIVAYGQSVGSGPVCSLACKADLCGIILHSPLLSAIKVVDPQPDRCCRPSAVWKCFDFYQNERRVTALRCPVLVMHGQRDEIIPFYHGYRLHQACPKEHRWPGYFPKRAGHNDLVEVDMRGYFGQMSNFLRDLRTRNDLPAEKASSAGMFPRVQQSQVHGDGPPAAASGASPDAAGARSAVTDKDSAASSADAGLAAGFVGEVPAGPKDDRYELFRRGQLLAPPSNESGARGDAWSEADGTEAGGADALTDVRAVV